MGNKYNLKDILESGYGDCKSSLKLSSLDDRDKNVVNYLCEDEKLEVFDFDLIKDKIAIGKKSPDAIYMREKNIYIIEFKNQNPCDINCKDLQEKFQFAVEFFKNTIKNILDYQFIICLVYKNQGQHKQSQRYKQGLKKTACCTLDDENKNSYNNFYSHIVTQDTNFYKNNFKELTC
ncbi:MAG: hypothetical protein U9N49_08405 [Campylobacterota bacterium]|nr:hypothetical protein [Campylobacterota bacterium]